MSTRGTIRWAPYGHDGTLTWATLAHDGTLTLEMLAHANTFIWATLVHDGTIRWATLNTRVSWDNHPLHTGGTPCDGQFWAQKGHTRWTTKADDGNLTWGT